jgi:hypothetical protein
MPHLHKALSAMPAIFITTWTTTERQMELAKGILPSFSVLITNSTFTMETT